MRERDREKERERKTEKEGRIEGGRKMGKERKWKTLDKDNRAKKHTTNPSVRKAIFSPLYENLRTGGSKV